MGLRNFITYPLAAVLALSPMAAQAQSYNPPARAAAELQQANAQSETGAPEGVIAIVIVVTVILFVALVVFDDDDDGLLNPTSP